MEKIAKILRSSLENKIHENEPSAFLESNLFPWAKEVEHLFPSIKKEVFNILSHLPQITNFDSVLSNQRALYQGDLWKSYFLVAGGTAVAEHQKQCPETSRALENIPYLLNAFFSILKPGIHIPPHRGPYAGIMRYHLGLIVPEGDLGIKVDGKTYRWKEGESVFFDDSFEHEAWNYTEGLRVILFVDFIRPLPQPLSVINHMMIQLIKSTHTVKSARKIVMDNQIE